jgi:hypothetical protein
MCSPIREQGRVSRCRFIAGKWTSTTVDNGIKHVIVDWCREEDEQKNPIKGRVREVITEEQQGVGSEGNDSSEFAVVEFRER